MFIYFFFVCAYAGTQLFYCEATAANANVPRIWGEDVGLWHVLSCTKCHRHNLGGREGGREGDET